MRFPHRREAATMRKPWVWGKDQYHSSRVELDKCMSQEVKMQKRILMLARSAFTLACGTTTASAQQGPMMQQQAQPQQHPNSSRSAHRRVPKCRAVVLEMTSTMTATYRAGTRA